MLVATDVRMWSCRKTEVVGRVGMLGKLRRRERERVRARRYGASIIERLVREGGAVGAASVVIGVGSGVNV